jgi:hypothetical protein
MSWLLALHGPRSEVLPGLAGSRACRLVPGLELATPGARAMAAALQRLAGQAASLRTIAGWPGWTRRAPRGWSTGCTCRVR